MNQAKIKFRAADTCIDHAATVEVELSVEWDDSGHLWINAADRCILRLQGVLRFLPDCATASMIDVKGGKAFIISEPLVPKEQSDVDTKS